MRCILPTDRFKTWYTCPPGAFRAALGMGRKTHQRVATAVKTSCVPVSVPPKLLDLEERARWENQCMLKFAP